MVGTISYVGYTKKYNVKDYGAVGDGVADDTNAIQNTIDAACSGSGVVFIPNGNYRVTSSISKSNFDIFIDGNGSTIFQDGNFDVFRFSSDFTGTISVSSIVDSSYTSSWGSNIVSRLQVSNTSSYNVGDIVKVFSDDLIPTSATADNERIGEFAEVLAINTNSEIILTSRLQFNYTSGIRVSKMNSDICCDIKDINAQSSATSENEFLTIQGYYKPVIRNITAIGLHGMLLRLESCLKARTENISGKDFDGLAYVVAEYSCDSGVHIGIRAENVRHGYTTGCIGSSVSNTNPLQHGSTRGSRVIGGTGFNCQNAAFDTHSDAVDVVFSDCQSYCSYTRGEGSNRGFQARGNVKFINCYGYQSNFVCQGAGATASDGFKVEFIGCRYEEDVSDGAILNPFRIIGGSDIGNKCSIKGGNIRSRTTNPIRSDNCDMIIEGVEFFPENSSTPQMIRLDENTYADIRNIWIDGSNCTATNFDVLLLTETTSSANMNGVECYGFNATDFRSYVNQNNVDNTVTAINCNCNQPPWLHPNGIENQSGDNAHVSYTVNHGLDGGSFLISQSFFSTSATHTLDTQGRLSHELINVINAQASVNEITDIETGIFVGQRYKIVNKSTSTDSFDVISGNNILLASTETVSVGASLLLIWDGSKWVK